MRSRSFCWLLSCLFLVCFLRSPAAGREAYLGESGFGARGLTLGGLAAGGGDLSSVYWNPADLAFNMDAAGLMFSQDHKFGLSNWQEQQIGFVLPGMSSYHLGGFYIRDGISLQEQQLGQLIDNPWQTTWFGFSAGLAVRPNLAVGGILKQVAMATEFDGERLLSKVLLADLALVSRSGNWQIGIVRKNQRLSGEMEVKPQWQAGLAWKGNGIRAQVQLISYSPPESNARGLSLGGGLEFVFRPGFSLRVGRSQMRLNEPAALIAGLGAKVGSLEFDYAYRIHSIGATHYLSTSWQL